MQHIFSSFSVVSMVSNISTVTWNGTYSDLSQNKSVVLPSNLSDIYTLSASTNLLCTPQFGLQTVQATYTMNDTTGSRQVQIQDPVSPPLRPLDGVASDSLSRAIMDSVAASTDVIGALFPNPNS